MSTIVRKLFHYSETPLKVVSSILKVSNNHQYTQYPSIKFHLLLA